MSYLFGGGGAQDLTGTVTATGSTTPRSLPDRCAEIFNVKDYGAIGNDTADDTTPIQNAINAALDNGGGTVLFPRGNYKVTAALTFSHNLALATGERPIVFRGIGPAKGVNLAGSSIRGNVANDFIVSQNDDVFVTLTGVTGTFQVGDVVTYLDAQSPNPVPPLIRKDPGNVLVHPGGGYGVPLVGATANGAPSGASGTVTAVVVPQPALCAIYDLAILNQNTTSGGACKMDNVLPPAVFNCYFSGFYGLIQFRNAYQGIVSGCKFQGPSSAAGSIGYYGVSAVIGCDFGGWDICYQHASIGGGVYNCRFESANQCIQTGIEFDGDQIASTGWAAIGNYCEAVNIGMELFCVHGFVGGNNMTGLVANGGSGERTADYIISGAGTNLVMSGNSTSGNVSDASYKIAPASCTGSVTFVCCTSGNSGTGNKWEIAKRPELRTVYINCTDLPVSHQTCTFAELPTTKIIGEQWTISDGEKDGGGVCAAGNVVQADDGAPSPAPQKLIVAWTGTNWKCVVALT